MKITIEIPEETVLATVSLATQSKDDFKTLHLGVFHIATADLVDGNTVDFKSSYPTKESEGEE